MKKNLVEMQKIVSLHHRHIQYEKSALTDNIISFKLDLSIYINCRVICRTNGPNLTVLSSVFNFAADNC